MAETVALVATRRGESYGREGERERERMHAKASATMKRSESYGREGKRKRERELKRRRKNMYKRSFIKNINNIIN